MLAYGHSAPLPSSVSLRTRAIRRALSHRGQPSLAMGAIRLILATGITSHRLWPGVVRRCEDHESGEFRSNGVTTCSSR